MAGQASQQQQQDAPRHVPLSEITHQGLLRALGAEAEALQKIHVRIQKQIQNLEMEEKLFKHMIQRERNAHTAEELEQLDSEEQHQQQGVQQQRHPEQHQQEQCILQPEQQNELSEQENYQMQQQPDVQGHQGLESIMQEED